jgi:hypothetical protein
MGRVHLGREAMPEVWQIKDLPEVRRPGPLRAIGIFDCAVHDDKRSFVTLR